MNRKIQKTKIGTVSADMERITRKTEGNKERDDRHKEGTTELLVYTETRCEKCEVIGELVTFTRARETQTACRCCEKQRKHSTTEEIGVESGKISKFLEISINTSDK